MIDYAELFDASHLKFIEEIEQAWEWEKSDDYEPLFDEEWLEEDDEFEEEHPFLGDLDLGDY